jgi:2-methylcitrate dehydratase PrpD
VTPATYRLAGKPFEIGDNPKVDAQFSIQYCVANALLRRSSRLEHFNEAMVREPVILDITKKINVFADSILEKRGHTAVDMQVKRVNGGVYRHSLDIASGVPGNPLSQEDHINRFKACIEYAADYFPQENAGKLVSFVENLAEVEDVRTVIPLLMKR